MASLESVNRVVRGELCILVVMVLVCLMSEDVDASAPDSFRSPGIMVITSEEEIKSFKISEPATDYKTGSLRSIHLKLPQRHTRPLKAEQSTRRRLRAPPQDSYEAPSGE
ncbi:hypothetical protein MPTK1_3g05210 [Marchantia polymorpha subsp. ruderalis]|uniref:Uncharacterized protein n=2 Tax=Marchantia polymorpha TaxID=3197 RepID=A0A176VT09_MARPO|nr:hypothetical protein AXG93_3368s1040 [Marchantia polymorpha subsp. ruderalis]PTQ43899.1 hypothetical protein MARPO_0022s0007 [Marchantia polymorpha]BBN04501.1 hypothetical protein Mp_3g05210 [Marchantia polymorpha subsp. ruderalis]|eukprot:PTQ43899.1 hypothetical protein MARPO_0022s0007 [Marchantia polymorpha]